MKAPSSEKLNHLPEVTQQVTRIQISRILNTYSYPKFSPSLYCFSKKNTFIIIFIFIYQEKLTVLLNYHTNFKEDQLLFV